MTAALIFLGAFVVLCAPGMWWVAGLAALIRGVVLAERGAREGRWA